MSDRIDKYEQAERLVRDAAFKLGNLGNDELSDQLMEIADSIETRKDAESEDYEELDEEDDLEDEDDE